MRTSTGCPSSQINGLLVTEPWQHLLGYVDVNPGPCPLKTPITGRIAGEPSTAFIDFAGTRELMRHLGTVCFIVLAYLTGMPPAEVLGLQSGCCPEVASGRHLIYRREFKDAFDEDGNHHSAGRLREVPWVAIPHVVREIRVLEKLAPADGLLFDAATHTFVNTPTRSTASLRYTALRARIESFAVWASAQARRLGRDGEAIPDDPHGAIGLARFRRTLAWHIARRPGGLVAPAIQYGHMRTAISGGYAARGRDGIHQLLDIETARATADTFTTLHDDLARGVGISGPAARRAIHAAAQAPAFPGRSAPTVRPATSSATQP